MFADIAPVSPDQMAELITTNARNATCELKHISFQLSLRWKRFVASRKHRDDVNIDHIARQFEKLLSDTSRKLVATMQVARQMKSFEDAKLVQDEWKGSLKPADIFQFIAREIQTQQMNIKLADVIERLRTYPMQKYCKKSAKRQSVQPISKGNGRQFSVTDTQPTPRRAVITKGSHRDSLDFMSADMIRRLADENTSIAEAGQINKHIESGLPHYDTSKPYFMPKLKILAHRFGLEVPCQMRTAADELEFFTSVHVVFRTITTTQNNQMRFVTGKTSKGKSILKESDWPLPPGSISTSQIDAVRSFALLKERHQVDTIFDSCSSFMEIESVQKITAWLQKQVQELTAVSKTLVTNPDRERKNLSKKRKYDLIKLAWDRVYEAITTKEGTEKLDRGDNHRQKSESYDFVRSYQMLGLADGTEQDMIVKSAQKDPSIASGALLAFLHLRHLDIRRLKFLCLSHFNYLYSAQRTAYNISQVFDKLKTAQLDDIQSDFDYYEKVEENGSVFMSVTDNTGHVTTYTSALDSFRRLEELIILLASNYSLKDTDFVDHMQLLHDMWTGIGDILTAKANQCELILEALYNATERIHIDQLNRRIILLLNYDFVHDVESTHCLLHFQRHATLIRRQNDLLMNLRIESLYEFRNQELQYTDKSELGPKIFLTSTFHPGKEKLFLCEVNPYFCELFTIIDEMENILNIELDGQQSSPTPLATLNQMIVICNHTVDFISPEMRDDKVSYSIQIQKDFFHLKILTSELCDETIRFTVADMINLHHTLRCFFTLRRLLKQTDVANLLYFGLADVLGFSRSHLFLRLVQPSLSSDSSVRQETTARGQRPVPADDRSVDRYRPTNYGLAVQDYDELIPKSISFKDVSSIADIALNPRKIEKLLITTKVQILHNQLMVAATRCSSIMTTWPCDATVGDENSTSKLTQGDTATVATSILPGDVKTQHYFAEMFVSLQWERQWPRAKYLEYFEASIGGANMDKVRVDALTRMCTEMENIIDELALRATIAEQTSRIVWMINSQWEGDFHISHFEIGESLRVNPDQKDVLSSGAFSNLFYLPHFTAIMAAGRRLTHEKLIVALQLWADSITSLADVLFIFIAQARLGHFGSGEKGSWGGPEGIHQQLLELRRELGKIDEEAVCRLMTLSRQQALLEIEMSLIQLKISHGFKCLIYLYIRVRL